MTTSLRYRPEIDGLRAIAVLPIMLFHAGLDVLAGGFVGVDIFFVISGYLITTIVRHDLADGRFTLIDFYRRRVVRIFPALFAMLALVLGWGAVRLLPYEFTELARSTAAALGFVSNVYFWRTTDYFAPAAELLPLLHTWSLGVEEQFYIVYPLLLAFLARRTRLPLGVVIPVLVVISLAACLVVGWSSPVAKFYLFPLRAWELLIGAAVAVGAFPVVSHPRARTALAAVGAAMVAAAVLLVRPGPLFPAPLALLPCIGAALIIAYGQGGAVARGLSWAPLRWIGTISYSLYLWHWPIIALYRLETGIHLGAFETAALVAASLAAGALSFALVERPFMNRFRARSSSGRVVAVGGAALVAGVVAVLALDASAPAWRRIDPEVARVASYADYRARPEYAYQFRRGPCFRGEAEAALAFSAEHCVRLDPARPDMAVIGDSYAAMLWRAFALRYPERNVMQANATGCRPLVGAAGDARCREVVDYALGPLLASGEVGTVVLAGRWLESDLAALPATIAHIRARGARAVVIGPVPEWEGDFPAILARALARGDLRAVEDWGVPERATLDARLAPIVTAAGGVYFSPFAACGAGGCPLRAPDRAPLQFDYGHLTLSGARYVVDRMPEIPVSAPSRLNIPRARHGLPDLAGAGASSE